MNEAARRRPRSGPRCSTRCWGWRSGGTARRCSTWSRSCPADDYLARRRELGARRGEPAADGAAGIGTFLVDTGLGARAALPRPGELAALAAATAHEVVRLETARGGGAGGGQPHVDVPERGRRAAALRPGPSAPKSIAAYRVGLDAARRRKPDRRRARAAPCAGADPRRLADRTVSGWLARTAIELGLPLQLHVGYGDSDLDLLDCDPLQLTRVPARHAGARRARCCCCTTTPSTATRRTSPRSSTTSSWTSAWPPTTPAPCRPRVVRETLELVPFGKLLFSSDAYGLAELYLLGALLFRRLGRPCSASLVDAGELTAADAAHVAGAGGARERPSGLRPVTVSPR